MISTTLVHVCPHCGSERLQNNGHFACVLAHLYACSQRVAPHPEVQRSGAGAYQDRMSLRGYPAHLRSLLSNRHDLAGKRSGTCPPSKTHCYPARTGTCWNWINSGASYRTRRKRSVCGWLCVGARARPSPGTWEMVGCKEPPTCTRLCPGSTGTATLSFGCLEPCSSFCLGKSQKTSP